MPEIQLEHITKSYTKQELFKDFSVTINSNQITSLLGSSGSGKTTILRLIAGLEVPDNGIIKMDGKIITKDTKYIISSTKRAVGFIFQNLALWPHFTVYKNIAFGLEVTKQKNIKEQVLQILDFFNLLEHKEKFPHELSGGQQQLVALARSLVLKPKVLLMDEPLANLDVKLKHKILSYIKDLKQSKIFGSELTIVYVTHDHKEAFAIADQVILLDDGNIVAQGTLDKIKQSKSTFVNYFLEY